MTRHAPAIIPGPHGSSPRIMARAVTTGRFTVAPFAAPRPMPRGGRGTIAAVARVRRRVAPRAARAS
jgi:hypothetical protein